MKILVYPALMEIGGSQINAIELAHGAAQRGHEVVLFGPDGVLVPTVQELGLEYLRAPREHTWPSRRNMACLREVVRARRIDVVHGYEWGPALDLAFGPHAALGTPMVTTVMSMEVPAFLPQHAPLVVGTRSLAEQERRKRSGVRLIEPPVDTGENAPASDSSAARERFGFAPGDVVLAVVCRLTPSLGKLGGILDAIDVVAGSADPRLRLLVVGDGPGLALVEDRAAMANRALGRPAVRVAGALLDPRDAYNAADVMLGMGSSALKGMAFAKPLVVQGERGFWRLLDEASLGAFLQDGWHGTGGDGVAALAPIVGGLAADPVRREALGRLGRRVIDERYSLERAIDTQVEVYAEALAGRLPTAIVRRSLARTALQVATWKVTSRLDRSKPLIAPEVPEPQPAIA